MVFDDPRGFERHSPDGVRRMDNLETGLCSGPERISHPRWIWLHGAFGKSRYYLNSVRAWGIIIFTTFTGVSAGLAFIFRGHW